MELLKVRKKFCARGNRKAFYDALRTKQKFRKMAIIQKECPQDFFAFVMCYGNADMHNYEPVEALRGFYKPFNMLTMAVFFISVNQHTITNYNVMFFIGRFWSERELFFAFTNFFVAFFDVGIVFAPINDGK
jgi:hypothetical protein